MSPSRSRPTRGGIRDALARLEGDAPAPADSSAVGVAVLAGGERVTRPPIQAKLARWRADDIDPSDGLGHGYIIHGERAGALNWGVVDARDCAVLESHGFALYEISSTPSYSDLAVVPPAST